MHVCMYFSGNEKINMSQNHPDNEIDKKRILTQDLHLDWSY